MSALISPVSESVFAGAGPAVHAQIADRIQALRPQLAALARDLYENPEVGFEEYRSSSRIADVLEDNGVTVERGAFGLPTAFRATVGHAGPHFAILAEYDALPGIGHACGHNAIAAIATGAFLGCVGLLPDARISLIGTPAEENGGGKELILRAGGFDTVDAAGMVHPASGDVVTPIEGFRTSGVRRLRVTYRGRAAHAAGSPHLGLNALDAVVTSYQSIAQLRQHILPTDRIHGIITNGGSAANVIPDTASAEYLVRSAEIDTLSSLTERVVDIINAAALGTGTRAEVDLDFAPPYLPLRDNVTLMRQWAAGLIDRGWQVPERLDGATSGAGSTDMGNVSWFVPAIHPAIGLGGPMDAHPHDERFAHTTITPAAFSAIEDAAIAIARAAADFLLDSQLRAAIAEEFNRNGGRRTTES